MYPIPSQVPKNMPAKFAVIADRSRAEGRGGKSFSRSPDA